MITLLFISSKFSPEKCSNYEFDYVKFDLKSDGWLLSYTHNKLDRSLGKYLTKKYYSNLPS